MSYALYIATAVGAIALYLMMPRKGVAPVRLGALLGAATLGGLWLYLQKHLPDLLGLPDPAMAYYYLFSFIAIGSAARVITHVRPVYSALWFVMVVLATAGLFLILDAEFMAFAMVIIYGGAILVTYVFVIMLASQSGDPQDDEQAPEYDRLGREPAAAILAGFVLLAVLLGVVFEAPPRNPKAAMASDVTIGATLLMDRPAERLARKAGTPVAGEARQIENIEHVGLDLFQSHPLGLELAGVILLVSLVGAVVIARKRVEAGTIAARQAPLNDGDAVRRT